MQLILDLTMDGSISQKELEIFSHGTLKGRFILCNLLFIKMEKYLHSVTTKIWVQNS